MDSDQSLAGLYGTMTTTTTPEQKKKPNSREVREKKRKRRSTQKKHPGVGEILNQVLIKEYKAMDIDVFTQPPHPGRESLLENLMAFTPQVHQLQRSLLIPLLPTGRAPSIWLYNDRKSAEVFSLQETQEWTKDMTPAAAAETQTSYLEFARPGMWLAHTMNQLLVNVETAQVTLDHFLQSDFPTSKAAWMQAVRLHNGFVKRLMEIFTHTHLTTQPGLLLVDHSHQTSSEPYLVNLTELHRRRRAALSSIIKKI